MTARQLYEYSLIEINKVEAPSLLLGDFNFFINKAVYNYVDKRYNLYEENQQVSDDLRVLIGTSVITSLTPVTGNVQGAIYIGQLPQDYFHMLGCIVEYNVLKAYKCFGASTHIQIGAKRLTAGMYPAIINNYYSKPSYKNPYYYIHNTTAPTIEVNQPGVADEQKTDMSRDGNASPVNIEIRYGKDSSTFALSSIIVDYLKVPRYILLTQDEIDDDEDLSSTIEFPDYVCYEIIKELVALILENASDPRLQTNIPLNKTIPEGGQPQRRQ